MSEGHVIVNGKKVYVKNNELTLMFMGIKDLSQIEGLAGLHLKRLMLNNNQIESVEGLDVPGVEVLDLSNNKIASMKGLQGATGLVELNLKGNNISQVESLDGLTRLKRLDLRDNAISDLSGIGSISSLEILDLRGNQVSEIAGLGDLQSLKQLNLGGNPVPAGLVDALGGLDYYGYARAPARVVEYCKGEGVTSTAPAADAPPKAAAAEKKIKPLVVNNELFLSFKNIESIDQIEGLSEYTDLRLLVLNNNQISEITGLDSLVNLEELYLSSNRISEIKGLDFLVKLKKLSLRDNKISMLEGLGNLEALEVLGLDGNQIDPSLLESLGGLDKNGHAKDPARIVAHCKSAGEVMAAVDAVQPGDLEPTPAEAAPPGGDNLGEENLHLVEEARQAFDKKKWKRAKELFMKSREICVLQNWPGGVAYANQMLEQVAMEEKREVGLQNYYLVEEAKKLLEEGDYNGAKERFERSKVICAEMGWFEGVKFAEDNLQKIERLLPW